MIFSTSRKLSEASAGDRRITKAVVLAPGYIPDRLVDNIEEFSFNVHAVNCNSVVNLLTREITGNCKTHAEIELKNHLDSEKIIGYVTKDTDDRVADVSLKSVASELLGGSGNKVTLEKELKNAWK